MWKVFLNLLMVFNADAEHLLRDVQTPSSGLTKAVTENILYVLQNKTVTVNVLFPSEDNEVSKLLEDSMNEIIYGTRNSILIQLDRNPQKGVSNRKKSHNIIFCDTLDSFEKIFYQIDSENFDFQGFYLIIITRNDTGKVLNDIDRMVELLWTKQIVNANILYVDNLEQSEVVMYTYYPYTKKFCGKAVPFELNRYQNGKWTKDVQYYPRKLRNLFGCSVIVATFENAPFMSFYHREGQIEIGGIDGVLLRNIAEVMNFTIELHPKNLEYEMWGDLNANGSANGAIQLVISGEANLTLGYFARNPTRDLFMTSSGNYYTSKLIWAVPPGRINTSLEKLIKPFDSSVWICFFFVLGSTFMTIGLLRWKLRQAESFVFGPKVSSPSLNVINLVLGGSLIKLPTRNFARTVLIMFLLYCFIMQNSYQGVLFKFMQMTLREKELSTTDELTDQDFKFYMLKPSTDIFAEIPKVSKRIVVVDPTGYANIFNNVTQSEFRGAVLSTNDHLAYRNILIWPDKFIHHAEEVIMTRNVVIYMTKQSSLACEIDQMILYLLSGGLVEFWVSKIVDDDFLKQKQLTTVSGLTTAQLYGAFQLLTTGLLMSFAVFIGELLAKALRKLSTKFFQA